MRELTAGIVIACVGLLAGCVTIVVNPHRAKSASAPRPESSGSLVPGVPLNHASDDPRFQFRGTWIGTLRGYDAPSFIDSKRYPLSFCVFIGSADNAKVYKWSKGKWKDFGNRPYSWTSWGSQAEVSALASGTDDDGTWVEGSRFTFVRYDADTSIVYWLRTVNNLDIPATAQYYYFAWGYSGRMHRVAAGGDTACGDDPTKQQ